MKRLVAILSIMLCIIGTTAVYATNDITTSQEQTTSKLIELKDKELNTLQDYRDSYGSDTYGLTAYILNKVRLYSIPIGFIAIAISAIYQYIIGIRKLDVRDKGFALMIASITLLVICQILPLVFAIIVRGWRG